MRILKKILMIISWAVVLEFTGCQNDILSDEEKVDFSLPSWPDAYPTLSRWQITLLAADFEKEFYLPSGAKNFSIQLKKNEPVCVSANPVTLLQNIDAGEKPESSQAAEAKFFKPAGTVYPYCSRGDFYSGNTECFLTWEEGFTAATMQKIIRSQRESGISRNKLKSFLMEFNWKKMNEKIQANIADSISTFENPAENTKARFYNPWQIDSANLLDNLTFAIFDSKYLNTSYIFTVSKESAKIPAQAEIFSSFIPENQILQKYGLLTLKKKRPQSYLLDKTYAVTLNAASAKNVSATFTYMPILIEDYEHPE